MFTEVQRVSDTKPQNFYCLSPFMLIRFTGFPKVSCKERSSKIQLSAKNQNLSLEYQ